MVVTGNEPAIGRISFCGYRNSLLSWGHGTRLPLNSMSSFAAVIAGRVILCEISGFNGGVWKNCFVESKTVKSGRN
jgi:hypothetical protein